METPYTNHIKADEFEFVYEPAEDTFLLLDALERDLPYIERLSPQICVEIGSGSGVIITALSKKLRNTFCIATDLNEYACKVTKRTSLHNKGFADVINTNFTQGIRDKCIDLLVFNPPYVVTETNELKTLSLEPSDDKKFVTNTQLVQSWAGGVNGRQVIDALLEKLDRMLSPGGTVYLLVLKENQPNVIEERLNQTGFNMEIFMERKIPGEHLYILKIRRKIFSM